MTRQVRRQLRDAWMPHMHCLLGTARQHWRVHLRQEQRVRGSPLRVSISKEGLTRNEVRDLDQPNLNVQGPGQRTACNQAAGQGQGLLGFLSLHAASAPSILSLSLSSQSLKGSLKEVAQPLHATRLAYLPHIPTSSDINCAASCLLCLPPHPSTC
jgi:hypothetical protein